MNYLSLPRIFVTAFIAFYSYQLLQFWGSSADFDLKVGATAVMVGMFILMVVMVCLTDKKSEDLTTMTGAGITMFGFMWLFSFMSKTTFPAATLLKYTFQVLAFIGAAYATYLGFDLQRLKQSPRTN